LALIASMSIVFTCHGWSGSLPLNPYATEMKPTRPLRVLITTGTFESARVR